MTIVQGGRLFLPDHRIERADLAFSEGVIRAVGAPGTLTGDVVVDAGGALVVPGFFDIHLHGALAAEFSEDGPAGMETIAAWLAKEGVTGFLGTSLTVGEDKLTACYRAAAELVGRDFPARSVLWGIHMEGPFFNTARRGAQNADYIQNPNLPMFERLWAAARGTIKLVDLAPELPGALEFIGQASQCARVSVAHTDADYAQAAAAFEAGASHVTHLFNAMPPFLHRAPGVVGAASDHAAFVEVIGDGIHLHPAVIRAAFRMFSDDRVCLISDTVPAAGMPDGIWEIGGLQITVAGDSATLTDGTIAGGTHSLADCVRRVLSFGVPLESVLRASSENPARAAGVFDQTGSLAVGKRADLLLLGGDYVPQAIWIGGERQ